MGMLGQSLSAVGQKVYELSSLRPLSSALREKLSRHDSDSIAADLSTVLVSGTGSLFGGSFFMSSHQSYTAGDVWKTESLYFHR